ncbi:MAG: hypothetical protein LBV23_02900, partial [Deltaproteobacteria bacterium]|nr:hypothetical protein [Deltaproteobacteria bacterium]
GLNELLLLIASLTSFRATAELLNRIRRDEDAFKETTLRNRTEREGEEMMLYLEKLTNEKVALLDELDNLKQSPSKSMDSFDEKYHIAPDVVAAGAKDLNIKKFNPDDYENPELTANVSVDEM